MTEKDNQQIAQLRRDYARESLSEEAVSKNPMDQFAHWFEQALSADLLDVNAMALSTVSDDGEPSSRIVLLKGVQDDGFCFYSNYGSRKGQELAVNPHAAICFYWAPLERQVRIEGKVERLSRKESESYFQQRPRLSKIGAWLQNRALKWHHEKNLRQISRR